MDMLSAAVADAFGLLRKDLYRHLDEAEFLATNEEEWTEEDIDLARKLIPDLVLVIRGLLYDHQVRPDGNCRICASSVWPCPVVTLIHGRIKDPHHQYVALYDRVHAKE